MHFGCDLPATGPHKHVGLYFLYCYFITAEMDDQIQTSRHPNHALLPLAVSSLMMCHDKRR